MKGAKLAIYNLRGRWDFFRFDEQMPQGGLLREEALVTKKRSFATVTWVVADVLEQAREAERAITKQEASNLLAGEEKRLIEAMVAAGRDVIDDALLDLVAGSRR